MRTLTALVFLSAATICAALVASSVAHADAPSAQKPAAIETLPASRGGQDLVKQYVSPRELHGSLVERRLKLEQQQGLLDVEDPGHRPPYVSGGPRLRGRVLVPLDECANCVPIRCDRQSAAYGALMQRLRPHRGTVIVIGIMATAGVAGVAALVAVVLIAVLAQGSQCQPPSATSIVLGPPGTGQRVGATEYGGPGGGHDLASVGVIFAGRRTGLMARIELICALGAGLRGEDLRAVFEA